MLCKGAVLYDPPLVTATPIDYATSSLPTPAQATATSKLNAATATVTAATSNSGSTPVVDIDNRHLSRHPTVIPQCSHCHQINANTRTLTFPSIETWLLCGGILLVFWPACWVPLVMDTAKKTDHICINCNAVVGSVRPFSDCCVKDRG